MNYFNNNKWWAIVVALLVILNTITLTVFWIERKANNVQLLQPDKRSGTKDYLIKELGLDSIQRLQYDELIHQHQQRTNEIRLHVRDAKDSFFALISDSTIAESTIAKASLYAAETEQQMDMETFNHFKNIRSICNAQQQKKFDSIIKNVVKMMGPNEQRPQRPPPNDDNHFRLDGPPPQDGEQREPPPNDGHEPPPKD